MTTTDFKQTSKQIRDREAGKNAILRAMLKGRHISLFDSQEFKVSQMHTAICQIRRDISKKNLPYTLNDRWIAPYGKQVKEYWITNNA